MKHHNYQLPTKVLEIIYYDTGHSTICILNKNNDLGLVFSKEMFIYETLKLDFVESPAIDQKIYKMNDIDFKILTTQSVREWNIKLSLSILDHQLKTFIDRGNVLTEPICDLIVNSVSKIFEKWFDIGLINYDGGSLFEAIENWKVEKLAEYNGESVLLRKPLIH